jgi:hypothetical protein
MRGQELSRRIEGGEPQLRWVPHEQGIVPAAPEPGRLEELPRAPPGSGDCPLKPSVRSVEEESPFTGVQKHDPAVAQDRPTPNVGEKGKVIPATVA